MENKTPFEKQIKRAVKFEDVKELIHLCNDNSKTSEILKFKEFNGQKLIHYAAIFGSLELLKILVDLGADFKEKVDEGENVLHLACRHGKIEVVDYLLRCMPMLSSENTITTGHESKYRNAFYFAAKSESPEIVKCLIKTGGMNINEIFPDGKTPLLTLLVENDHKGAEVLFQCGANVNSGTFNRGLKAIHYAAEKSYSGGMIKLLIKYGANVNEPWSSRKTGLYQQPLFMALKKGNNENAKALLECGADVNAGGHTSNTAMGWISCFSLAAKRCPSLIQEFLKHGANPNECHNGETILMQAMDNCLHDKATIEALVKAGANINKGRCGKTAIQCCETYDQLLPFIRGGITVEVIEKQHKISTLLLALKQNDHRYTRPNKDVSLNIIELLSLGANPNISKEKEDSPLIVATRQGLADVVDILLQAGANVNHIGSDGNAAIHISCISGGSREFDRETISLLLKHGACLNSKNDIGETPLFCYIKKGKRYATQENVFFLLNNGADPNECDKGRDSPLIVAINENMQTIVESLIEAKSDVNHVGERGNTALHSILKSDKRSTDRSARSSPAESEAGNYVIETVTRLIDSGANVNAVTEDGESPLSCLLYKYDMTKKDCTILQILLEHGADPNVGTDVPLITPAQVHNFSVVQSLLISGADVDNRNTYGETALMAAIEGTCVFRAEGLETMKILLDAGASTNIKDNDGNSPLSIAIKQSISSDKRVHPVVRLLLEKGVNLNAENIGDDSPLMMAVEHLSLPVVEVLIKAGANVNHIGRDGQTSLHKCFSRKDCKTVEAMMDVILPQKPRFDIVDKTGTTALDILLKNFTKSFDRSDYIEYRCNNFDRYDKDIFDVSNALIQRFLEAGVKVKVEDLNDMLLVNAIRGDFQGMEFLIGHGADKHVKMEDGKSILHLCWSKPLSKALQFLEFYISTGGVFENIEEGKRSILMALLESADVSQDNFETRDNQVAILATFLLKHKAFCGTENGNSPLHIAAKNGYATTIGVLIEFGCDPCACNERGDTALHFCLKNPIPNVSKVISKLLKNKESIDICNKSGETPLYLATVYRKYSGCRIDKDNASLSGKLKNIISVLVHHGAHLYLQTSHREETAVSSEDMIKILLDHGANPNKHTPNKIPLLAAVEKRDIKSTILLLESGADVNATQNRKSSLHILFGKYDNQEIDESLFQILLEKGIDVNLVDTEERTALFIAVKKYTERRFDKDNASLSVKLKNIISALVHHGADINHIDNSFETVLSILCKSGTMGSVGTFLLEVGADPTKGRYIHSAIRSYQVDSNNSEWEDFICELLQKGADPNAHSESEPNLITSTERGLTRVVGKMLEHGADVNAKDYARKTALRHACSLDTTKGRDDIIQHLVRSGASLVLSSSDGGNPLDILVQNVIKNMKTSELTTNEYGNLQIEVDLTSFNLLVKGGCDSKPVIASNQERMHVGSYLDEDEMLPGEDEDRSIILLLIKNGLLKAAEYLIQSGWDIQNESWFESFDVFKLDLVTVKVMGSDYKRSDIDTKKKDLQTLIEQIRKEPTSLVRQCRKVVRKQLLEASKGTSIEAKAFLLPLPEQIKSFVSINDHIQAKEIIELEEKSIITSSPPIDVMRVLPTMMFPTGRLFPTTLTYGGYDRYHHTYRYGNHYYGD